MKAISLLVLFLYGVITPSQAAAASDVVLYDIRIFNEYGYKQPIWAEGGSIPSTVAGQPNVNSAADAKAFGFCRVNNFDFAVTYTTTCGEDESTYMDYTGQGNWVSRDSGSANRCYKLLSTVTCRTKR
ncbi:hypothetical protein [Alteromonas sp. S015]|uniref:hypothetical protein n=1 Tax=Alteromonas sp. S015 TaxID=3117401 RepID=UPI002FE3CE98